METSVIRKLPLSPKPGDEVGLVWGVDHYIVTVRQIYESAGGRHALVEIPVPGAKGETLSTITASVPVERLEEAV